MSVRYSYISAAQLPNQVSSKSSVSSIHSSRSSSTFSTWRHEDPVSRDLRVFGGLENETESSDLRGPMLDVVLGLFDGIDYDDASC